MQRDALSALCRVGAGLFLSCTLPACNSIINGWLDPTTVGSFDRTAIQDIRTSLTLEDLPAGIPGATYPTPDDLRVIPQEYPISGGDTLLIEINELRQRQTPWQGQLVVAPEGYLNLPVVGRIQAAGLTVPQLQDAISESLRDRGVLLTPEVTINPAFLNRATYSIFGIGVSAANDAPLRAGTFPIRRPDLRLLEAINQVGGLNEFVTEIYIFRKDAADQVPGESSEHASDVPGERSLHHSGRGTTLVASPPALGAASPVQDAARPDDAERDPGREAVEDLLNVVDARQEKPIERPQAPPRMPREVPENLEPEAIDPFIFVGGEFVVNPAYSSPGRDPQAGSGRSPTVDTIMPAVNWARIAGETSYRILVVPADLLRAGDQNINLTVRAGDVIRVVSGEIGVYYVMGQVNRVGTFTFNAEPVTLKAAIAAAGGLSSLAWPDRCTVYRRLGRRDQMIQVDLDRVFAGKDPDFFIRRGDIINVGTHPLAPFLQRIRGLTLPNPITNVGYSYTYARNFADVDSFAVRQNPHNEPGLVQQLFP
ncbi:MAG: polysaccharide biosynthesis/export family protein [Planctomycetota bacterium]